MIHALAAFVETAQPRRYPDSAWAVITTHDLRRSGDSRTGDGVRTQKRLGPMTNERGCREIRQRSPRWPACRSAVV